jgi:hypothetical protein
MDFNKLIFDLPSEEYHKTEGTYSSSQLKDMLKDPEVFYKKYITKEIKRDEDNAQFATGTYFHTAILEPEKLDQECVVFQGAVRRGAEWDKFKEQHKGKAIVTKGDKEKAEIIIKAVKNSPISMSYLEKSKPEVSIFVKLYVLGTEIFAFRDDTCFCLTSEGWVPTSLDYEEEDIKDYGVEIIVKTRADALSEELATISDLKSTTGNTMKEYEMRSKVQDYEYDLSAALYLDIFSVGTGILFEKFVWIFASKDVGNAKSWEASDKYIRVGRAKWRKAIIDIAKFQTNGWQFVDELGVMEPPQHSLDWLSTF